MNTAENKISLEDACQIAQLYDSTEHFVPSRYIDVDDRGIWRVAIVTERAGNVVSIHFEAWAPRYDERNVRLDSARLAPFRRRTMGYTGQEKQAYRDFKFQPAKHLEFEHRLEEILEGMADPKETTADKLTQFLRGDLFFYVDSLLTLAHLASPDLLAIDSIFHILERTLALVAAWEKRFPELRPAYDAMSGNEKLYLVHPGAAFVASYSELAATLRSCFGLNRRVIDTFKVTI